MKKNLSLILIGTALILMVPLVAMQFSDDVQWELGDFIVMGGLLVGTGVAFELIKSRVNKKYHAVLALALLAALLLTWAELAVGVFGSPFAGN